MSTPTIPPRPARASAGPTAVKDNMPSVPPRPVRKLDPSPIRETRSPLNELPNPLAAAGKRRSQSNLGPSDVPLRPPIVTLPSVGQEGLEYASYDQLPPEARAINVPTPSSSEVAAPEQTRNVSANMPLHAPKASVPQSTAKSRIETVTRTDSTQAAAIGIGKARPDDDVHKSPADSSNSLNRVTSRTDDLRRVPSADPHPLRQRTSFSRSSSSLPHGTSRPNSTLEVGNEQGIPEIGMQIPLHPFAGDVQAPSPAPSQSQHAPGIGFFNDGSARAHNRKRSSRQDFGPPGSYGLHGHGQDPIDQFEREWAVKHPDQVAKEGANANFFGTLRPETALSSEELNRIVSQTNDIGMGTDPTMIGTPGEDIAWQATQEFTSRSSQPSPAMLPERKKRQSSGTEAARSLLGKSSYPFPESSRGMSNEAFTDDDGNVIHVGPSEKRGNKVTGGGEADGKLDLGVHGGNTEEEGGWIDERGEGTPILASDEIIKRPGSAYMQPAVPPDAERITADDYYDSDQPDSRRNSMRVPSRPSSRPNSMHGEYHGGSLSRFMSREEHFGSGMHTPLEEIEEYEPLIPEGEEEQAPKPKVLLKRPGLEHHHFPSQDIWEDTPLSLQYSTTVETPEPPREMKAVAPPPPSTSTAFETPEQEQQRRDQNPHDMFSDSKTFIKPQYKPGVKEEMEGRPGIQRFPSRDIWEDTPDSMRLVTTVNSPQMDETKSPPEDRPTTTALPGSQDDADARATTGITQAIKPQIPSRPHRKSRLAEEVRPEGLEDSQKDESATRDIAVVGGEKQLSPDKAKAPAVPDRPKPTIPARPARPSRTEQDGAPLAKSTSVDSQASTETVTSPPVPKAKPVVPARPAGEKIASLKAGFMNDLNNRLKLGPQGPPPKTKEIEPEVAEETQKAPLADARKGRAKGPTRRKPAASPSAAAAAIDERPAALSMSAVSTTWHIDENDALQVPSVTATPPETEPKVDIPALEKALTQNEESNTTEPTLAEPMSPEKAEVPTLEKALTQNEEHNTAEPTLAEPMSPEKAEASLSTQPEEPTGKEDHLPEISQPPEAADEQKAKQSELEAALRDAGAAPAPAEVEKADMATQQATEGEADRTITAVELQPSAELEDAAKVA